MSADNPREERLQIMLSESELMILDDFRFKQRMPSRAAAVRELIKRGLSAVGYGPGAFGGKSSEYGVAGDSPSKAPPDGVSAPVRGSRDRAPPK
jgi:hypothetical protein